MILFKEIIIFNIWFLRYFENIYNVRCFLNALAAHGLHQSVDSTTHKDGHILDLVVARPEDNLVDRCRVLTIHGFNNFCVLEMFNIATFLWLVMCYCT